MATKTKAPVSQAQIDEVLAGMVRINAQIAQRLACGHSDPTNVEATLFCPKCVSVRAISAAGSTQERFRVTHNALVNALRVLSGEPAEQIRSITAQARPIMHSWGW